MTSLSPRFARPSARPHPIRALAVEAVQESGGEWLDDLRLFATGWLAGLVFFGTLLA